jgi:hypothetical protein
MLNEQKRSQVGAMLVGATPRVVSLPPQSPEPPQPAGFARRATARGRAQAVGLRAPDWWALLAIPLRRGSGGSAELAGTPSQAPIATPAGSGTQQGQGSRDGTARRGMVVRNLAEVTMQALPLTS